jgi:hypothetical protein
MPPELPPDELLPPLSLLLPQAAAVRATTVTPTAHLTRVAPRIVCLLMGHK